MTPVQQRVDKDCACAALATLSGQSYEDCYLEVVKVDPVSRGKQGLWNHEVVQVARHLGLVLVPTYRYDLDTDEGILRIRWNRSDDAHFGGHFVAVRNGRIACPSGRRPVAIEWRDYLTMENARPCTLLRLA